MSVPDGLLVLLDEGPRHGYQLARELSERTAGEWSINTGQVYTTLDRLARDGFVEPDTSEGDSRRRRWRITPLGSERSGKWLDSTPRQYPERDELVLRVLLVAARDPAAALRVVDAQRSELTRHLQTLRQDLRGSQAAPLTSQLAGDATGARAEYLLGWLDRAEQRLLAATRNQQEQL